MMKGAYHRTSRAKPRRKPTAVLVTPVAADEFERDFSEAPIARMYGMPYRRPRYAPWQEVTSETDALPQAEPAGT